ncbi:Hypothetical predicted protein, partial [Olea europaea subsp. europaea]
MKWIHWTSLNNAKSNVRAWLRKDTQINGARSCYSYARKSREDKEEARIGMK